MPNHINNKLQFIDTIEEVQKIRNYIQSENPDGTIQIIDFDKIIPMPDSIHNTQPLLDECNNKHIINSINSSPTEQQQIIKKTNIFFDRLEWSIKNWGTKWNAYDCFDDDSVNTIYFNSAWTSPLYVIKKLSEIFPSTVLILIYVDSINDFSTGKIKMQNGRIIECEGDGKYENINIYLQEFLN